MGEAATAGDPFEALGDPNRREILRLLSSGDKPVQAIAAALPISRPAVSRHLRLLKDAGLVAEHPKARGGSTTCRPRVCTPSRLISKAFGATPRPGFAYLAENTDRTPRP